MEYMFCFTTVYIHILHLFINLRSESGGKKIQEKYKKIKKESFNEKGEKDPIISVSFQYSHLQRKWE